jgi:protein-tyrosine phosphatase
MRVQVNPQKHERERGLRSAAAANFRDIGGYRVSRGQVIRGGMFLRSGSLCGLNAASLDPCSQFGIKTVCDLRSDFERSMEPSAISNGSNCLMLSCPIYPVGVTKMIRDIHDGVLRTAEEVRRRIKLHYEEYPRKSIPELRLLFERVLDPAALPILVHCTSGKDRTGFVTALVLLALETSEETILEDYLLSNKYRRDLGNVVGPELGFEARSALAYVQPEYLKAAFCSMSALSGSPYRYLSDTLCLKEARLVQFRNTMLI